MNTLSITLACIAVLVPLSICFAVLRRVVARPSRGLTELFVVFLGACAFGISALIEQAIERFAGFGKLSVPLDLSIFFYAFMVAAPLEQALKVLAIAPVLRSQHFREPLDGVVFAALSALGFISANNALYLAFSEPSAIALSRAFLAVPAHVLVAGVWGYALGRDPRRRLGGRGFDAAWAVAFLLNALFDRLVFLASPTVVLAAALPLLLGVSVLMVFAVRDLLKRGSVISLGLNWAKRSLSKLSPASVTSMRDVMREALTRVERPVTLTWILFGALVTTGVISAMLAAAVYVGNAMGIDFAAVERSEGPRDVVLPLLLLGFAAMLAFPIAGFLNAKASAARTVIEPAMSAGLALVGSLVLLGFAAPISLVFALISAPIALGLACAGAYAGLAR